MAFLDVTFPEDIAMGSKYGPMWNTQVIRVASGYEKRNQRWSDALYNGDVGYGVTSAALMQDLIDFFLEVRGRAYSFRFKDPGDYSVTDEAVSQDGSPAVQLIKTYGTGLNNCVREITKPRAGITMKRNGSSYTGFTLDTDTGIVTLDALTTASITDITQAANGVVTTSAAHGLSSGDYVLIDSVGGMTEVNGNYYTITVLTTTTFELNADTSTFTAYTSGGTVYKYVQPTDSLTWSGEFDNHCRFDTDSFEPVWDDFGLQSISVPIAEVRG